VGERERKREVGEGETWGGESSNVYYHGRVSVMIL
jgi:hypothetical protein